MRGHRAARVLKFVAIAAVAVAALSAFVMLLWNWLMPAIFGWRVITYWQAAGLLALSRILFGRFGGPGRRGHWRRRMRERWEQMTPEQREQFLHGIESAGFGPGQAGPAA